MRQIFMPVVLVLAITGVVSGTAAQTPDDVTRLKSEIEILRKQVRNLEKENELLKREIELMKKEAKSKPDAPKDPKTEAKSRTKTSAFGVDFELVSCVRDRKRRTMVTFTFAARLQDDTIRCNLGAYRELNLITSDGKPLNAIWGARPPSSRPNGKIVNGPELPLMIRPEEKERWVRFQVIFEGVDEEVTTFNQVELITGSRIGIQRHPAVRFYDIKIESK